MGFTSNIVHQWLHRPEAFSSSGNVQGTGVNFPVIMSYVMAFRTTEVIFCVILSRHNGFRASPHAKHPTVTFHYRHVRNHVFSNASPCHNNSCQTSLGWWHEFLFREKNEHFNDFWHKTWDLPQTLYTNDYTSLKPLVRLEMSNVHE